MKKTTRKLTFDAETIRNLTSGHLAHVAGGGIGEAMTVSATASAAGGASCHCGPATNFVTCTNTYVTVLPR